MPHIIDSGLLSHNPQRGAYMPSISELSDGTLIACQHVGSELASPDNDIEVLTTPDGGKTWENRGSIHGQPPNDGWAYRGPYIFETPEGRLTLTATRFETTDAALFDADSEALQRPEMLLYWSEDRGLTWSAPQVVPVDLPPEKYTWNGAGPLQQLAADRWMYPLETWKPEGYAGPPDQKAAAVFSSDGGKSWGDFTPIADDPSGEILYWDQMNTRLPDGRVYVMLWTHRYGTSMDLANHWVASDDEGRTWSEPVATNLMGQVCCPIALPDGRVAAIYNDRHDPQGVRLAISDDLTRFDVTGQLTLFDAGVEATLGTTEHENFLAEHMLIGFGKPGGILLAEGTLMTWFWCTVSGVTHTRWAKVAVD